MESLVGNLIPKMHRNSETNGKTNNGSPVKKSNFDRTVIDFDTVIEKYILLFFMNDMKIKNFEEIDVVANWNRVEIIQDEAQFEITLKDKLPASQTLFKTSFINKTDIEQEYSFKTERTTCQTCTYSFIQGFCRTKEGGIKFKLPEEILEIGGGVTSEQSVEYGKDETKEDAITWSVDNVVRVPPRSTTQAELKIDEEHYNTNFTVEVKMRGRLVLILNKRESSTFIKSISADIDQIIEQVKIKNVIPRLSEVFEVVTINGTKYVRVILRGKCDFRLAVSQYVTLSQQKI